MQNIYKINVETAMSISNNQPPPVLHINALLVTMINKVNKANVYFMQLLVITINDC